MGAGRLDHCLRCFSYDFKNGICLKCGWKSESAKFQEKLNISKEVVNKNEYEK